MSFLMINLDEYVRDCPTHTHKKKKEKGKKRVFRDGNNQCNFKYVNLQVRGDPIISKS